MYPLPKAIISLDPATSDSQSGAQMTAGHWPATTDKILDLEDFAEGEEAAEEADDHAAARYAAAAAAGAAHVAASGDSAGPAAAAPAAASMTHAPLVLPSRGPESIRPR